MGGRRRLIGEKGGVILWRGGGRIFWWCASVCSSLCTTTKKKRDKSVKCAFVLCCVVDSVTSHPLLARPYLKRVKMSLKFLMQQPYIASLFTCFLDYCSRITTPLNLNDGLCGDMGVLGRGVLGDGEQTIETPPHIFHCLQAGHRQSG